MLSITSVLELLLPPRLRYGTRAAQVLPGHKEVGCYSSGGLSSFSGCGGGQRSVARFVSRCCEKRLPELVTEQIRFLQKTQENVVALLKAQLHFRATAEILPLQGPTA